MVFMGYLIAFSHREQNEEVQRSEGISIKYWTFVRHTKHSSGICSSFSPVLHAPSFSSSISCWEQVAASCGRAENCREWAAGYYFPGTFAIFCLACFLQTAAHILNNTNTNITTTITIVLFGFANIVLLIHLSVCNI